MKTKIEKLTQCSRKVSIEVSAEELRPQFEQVYTDIGKVARVSGFRQGKVPRDLLEVHYAQRAKEEVIKRAIPQYYLKAVQEKGLLPVATPEIEEVQFKDHILSFNAKIDVRPEVKLKVYKNLRLKKKKIEIGPEQIEQTLERLRKVKAKEAKNDDELAKGLGFKSVEELKEHLVSDLRLHADIEIKHALRQQLLTLLLEKASLEVPQSLVGHQMQEVINQLKLNRMLQGEKKEDIEAKGKELDEEARKEAVRRIKLSFILDEIGQLENIQVEEKDLDQRIAQIVQETGKSEDQVRQYLDRENLISSLKQDLRDAKTIEFLLKEAKIEEEK